MTGQGRSFFMQGQRNPAVAALDNMAAVPADYQIGKSPAVKKKIIDAAAHTAFADHRVDRREAELLRVVSIVLDVPLPLFLPEPVAE